MPSVIAQYKYVQCTGMLLFMCYQLALTRSLVFRMHGLILRFSPIVSQINSVVAVIHPLIQLHHNLGFAVQVFVFCGQPLGSLKINTIDNVNMCF